MSDRLTFQDVIATLLTNVYEGNSVYLIYTCYLCYYCRSVNYGEGVCVIGFSGFINFSAGSTWAGMARTSMAWVETARLDNTYNSLGTSHKTGLD